MKKCEVTCQRFGNEIGQWTTTNRVRSSSKHFSSELDVLNLFACLGVFALGQEIKTPTDSYRQREREEREGEKDKKN